MTKDQRIIINGSFNVRAKRLIGQLDRDCRNEGLQAFLLEDPDTYNKDYPTKIYLTMGQAVEVMRLVSLLKQNGMKVV